MDIFNQQSIVPNHFINISKKKQQEKNELINFLVNELSHLLNEDIWIYIQKMKNQLLT
jgi:hypothetical protein